MNADRVRGIINEIFICSKRIEATYSVRRTHFSWWENYIHFINGLVRFFFQICWKWHAGVGIFTYFSLCKYCIHVSLGALYKETHFIHKNRWSKFQKAVYYLFFFFQYVRWRFTSILYMPKWLIPILLYSSSFVAYFALLFCWSAVCRLPFIVFIVGIWN